MTDTGGTERLHYEHSTKISVTCSIIGLVLGVTSLFVNELIAVYSDNKDTSANGYCGFNSVWSSNNDGYEGYYYTHICDDWTFWAFGDDSTPIFVEAKYACDTVGVGIGWLILGLIAVLLGFSSLGVYFVDKSKAAKFIEFFCCLFAVGAIIVWFIDNDFCWDSDAVDEEVVRLGASIWLMMFAAVAWFAAGVIAFF